MYFIVVTPWGETKIKRPGFINCDGVYFINRVNKMLEVGWIGVFDSKIIY